MRILVVEDNEPIRRMIIRFVADLVDEFIECEDASEALAAYQHYSPDLVLMDIKLREVDGLEATRLIKAAFSYARVVIVSYWDSPALRETARVAGAYGYVAKSDLLPLRDLIRWSAPSAGSRKHQAGGSQPGTVPETSSKAVQH